MPEIFAHGVEKTKGKTYIASPKLLSANEIMQAFTRVTGKKAYYDPITYEEFADMAASIMGPAFKQCLLEMKQWAGQTPEGKINYGCSDPEEDISSGGDHSRGLASGIGFRRVSVPGAD